MKTIANIAAYIFIVAVILLCVISIFGVWEYFASDVIGKSFKSIGLLAIVSVIVISADHLMKTKNSQEVTPTDTSSQEVFTFMRIVTLTTLIASVALLALLGVLAIWEVMSGEVLYKSLVSIGIIGFCSLIITLMCLEREGNEYMKNKNISGITVFFFVVIAIILFSIFN